MSIYAQFDENGDQVQIASTSAWGDFIDWADSIAAKETPVLSELVEEGVTENLHALISELARAIKSQPPSKHVAATAKSLLRALRKNAGAEIVLITNGVKFDESDDDEHDPTVL